MTSNRKNEVQEAIIRSMSAFGVNNSETYQSMSFVGLGQMRRDIAIGEFVEVLKSMEGVIIDLEAHEVLVPTYYFKSL